MRKPHGPAHQIYKRLNRGRRLNMYWAKREGKTRPPPLIYFCTFCTFKIWEKKCFYQGKVKQVKQYERTNFNKFNRTRAAGGGREIGKAQLIQSKFDYFTRIIVMLFANCTRHTTDDVGKKKNITLTITTSAANDDGV